MAGNEKADRAGRTSKGSEAKVPKRDQFFSKLKKVAKKPVTTPEWKDAAKPSPTDRDKQ